MPASITHMLTHSADILRPSRTGDTSGGRRRVLSAVASGVPCRASGMAMGTVQDQDGRLTSDTARPVYFEPDTDVRVGDVLRLYDEDGVFTGSHLAEARDRSDVYLKVQARGEQPALANLGALA